MQPAQILNLATKYLTELKGRGHLSVKADTSIFVSPDDKLNHAVWMCFQNALMVNQSDKPEELEKAGRWLGFIQGVLWSYDVETVDQMREDNKETA